MSRLNFAKPPLAILFLLVSFGSISAVLFTPALPQITQALGITPSQAQFTMTAFLIGYAIGNLPYGPLSNRFGRKPAIYIGTLLAAIGSVLIVWAGRNSLFWLFVVGRFLMALGSTVGLKISFTMIGDVYEQKLATRKISHLMLAFATGPGIAVALGGLLTDHLGWQSCFYFTAVYSLVLLFLSLFLPETITARDKEALKPSRISAAYLQALKNQRLIACALLMGGGASFVYLFASEAPFLGIGAIGLTAEDYGLLNLIPPVGMAAGSLVSNALAGRKEPLRVIQFGIFISLFAATVMLVLFLVWPLTAWSLFLPIPFFYFGSSLIFANASSMAILHAKDKSNASAIMNFINVGTAVIMVLLLEALPPHRSYVLPLFFTVIAGLMLALPAWIAAFQQKNARASA